MKFWFLGIVGVMIVSGCADKQAAQPQRSYEQQNAASQQALDTLDEDMR